jgi:predicted AlkP superfamily phosphohydrolase/phosphomutase
LALDACDPRLARRFAAEGDMPNLARVLDGSTVAPVLTDPGLFVGSVWASVSTARDPATHGFHCWQVSDPDSYDLRDTTPDEIDGTAFWYHLSDAGHRVAVLDVPHSKADRPIHGVQLVEWGCHDRHFGPHSYPPELIDELVEAIGGHPIGMLEPPGPEQPQFAPCDYGHRTDWRRAPDEYVALWEDLLVGMDRKRDASLALLDRGGWDMFMTVLGESHCAGHQFWHLSDRSHPEHDAALAARIGGDPMREVYRRLDATLGDHLDRTDDSTVVAVHLSHGMGAHHDGTHLLAPVLERLEGHVDRGTSVGWRSRMARWSRGLPSSARRSLLCSAAPAIRHQVERAPGAPLHHPVYDLRPGPDRLWWSTPNNTVSGAIRLNVAGREPDGRIQPDEYRPALEWLREALLDLVNIETGRPAANDVLLADDIYARHDADTLPDLFVQWDQDDPIEKVWSPLTGVVIRPYDHWRTGDHRPGGLLALRVPGVARRRDVEAVRSIDLAPTMAATIGVTLPDVDGRPRPDLLGHLAPERPPPRNPDRPLDPVPARPWRRSRRRWREGLVVVARSLEDARGRLFDLETEHRDAVGDLRSSIREESTTRDEADEQLRAENRELTDRLRRAELHASLFTTSAWVDQAEVSGQPLISVVTATYNRADRIGTAIDSVRAQTYPHWEMVVVDDGGDDDTAGVVAAYDDPRLRYLRVEHRGCNPARNAGLRAARGELVVHLDDDNRLDPHWLRAVAWAFGEHPDDVLAYGARVVDDMRRLTERSDGGLPGVHFEPWDRERCEGYNIVDLNVIAHRADPDLCLEEDANLLGDWDLVLKLSEDRPPLTLPVVAAYYTTTAPDRLTDHLTTAEYERQYHVIRDGIARRRAAREAAAFRPGR